MTDQQIEKLAEQLLAESREELGRADAKAAMLLASFSLLVGVVIAGLFAGEFKPADLHCGGGPIWWVGCGAVAAALIALARAIYPTLRHGEAEGPITYFGHAAGKSATAIEAALKRQVEGERSRTIEQLAVISAIVWRKYLFVQAALWLFGAGVALCIFGVLIG
jgi:ribosomal protein S12 methylthiotransferase accessory factor YcaO